jgi:hypothetical protein
MSDPITSLFSGAADSAANMLEQGGGEFSGALMKIIGQQDNPIFVLTQALKDGELTAEEFKDEIEREKKVLEAQLITLEIIAVSEVQKALNSALSALTSAATAGL